MKSLHTVKPNLSYSERNFLEGFKSAGAVKDDIKPINLNLPVQEPTPTLEPTPQPVQEPALTPTPTSTPEPEILVIEKPIEKPIRTL